MAHIIKLLLKPMFIKCLEFVSFKNVSADSYNMDVFL